MSKRTQKNKAVYGERRNENYRSWIRKNSEPAGFVRIQLRFVVGFFLPLAELNSNAKTTGNQRD